MLYNTGLRDYLSSAVKEILFNHYFAKTHQSGE